MINGVSIGITKTGAMILKKFFKTKKVYKNLKIAACKNNKIKMIFSVVYLQEIIIKNIEYHKLVLLLRLVKD